MKYKFELILNEPQFHKLLDEVNKIGRDIRIQEFKQLPSSFGAANYQVTLQAGDLESVFLLGAAWALPEVTKWSKFLKQLKSWVTLR